MKILRILELSWLAIAVISMLIGAYVYNTQGFGEAKWFFIFTLVAGIMYSVRRKQRIAYSGKDQEQKKDNSR